MTFEEFQKTRKDMSGAQAVQRFGEEELGGLYGTDQETRVLVYVDGLLIGVFRHQSDPEDPRNGEFYLIIERDETVTPDLEALERKLYSFAVASGYVDSEKV